jgi:septum formation protein
MAEWGYDFTVWPPSESAERLPESAASLTPQQLVNTLAAKKTCDVALRTERGIIIGCDTVVECQGQILGKPRDQAHARQMLELLRGHEHQVFSGLCLWRRPDDLFRTEVDITTLIMDAISNLDLDDYLVTGQWEGKAGAFGYQDGLDWVHIVAGSESNVVGLPMELLARMLQEFQRSA